MNNAQIEKSLVFSHAFLTPVLTASGPSSGVTVGKLFNRHSFQLKFLAQFQKFVMFK